LIVEISLQGAKRKEDVLARFGESLELGGPGGNAPVDRLQGKGWGFNWDALADSLCELATGGIWGTSRKLAFPLHLRITGSKEFRRRSPDDFEQLYSILRATETHYSQQDQGFDFEIA
jgi:hypothetical protein